ncbi:transposase [Microbacterium sp. USHLN186]|uniref:transposase n=1 Tax=Microbacterium sp. USHLN186 TaxID=3081286 RepID=UPI003018ADB2
MSDAGALDAIAAELYSAPPDQFVAIRNARAKEAADPQLAAQIRRLRKPSTAAWVVNVFARERSARLQQALQLAAELREAQADLDAATLSQLGRQRRALTGQLAHEASSLAQSLGARVTDATREAVRQIISAAFFDEQAAAAVASGRLVQDLEPTASFDLDVLVAGGRPAPPAAAAAPADEVRARRERRAAERALHEAERALERARGAERRADARQQDAAAELERIDEHIAELEDALARARADRGRAADDAQDAEKHHDDALQQVETAEGAVAAASAGIRRISEPPTLK